MVGEIRELPCGTVRAGAGDRPDQAGLQHLSAYMWARSRDGSG